MPQTDSLPGSDTRQHKSKIQSKICEFASANRSRYFDASQRSICAAQWRHRGFLKVRAAFESDYDFCGTESRIWRRCRH
jgi:hypothetical protein